MTKKVWKKITTWIMVLSIFTSSLPVSPGLQQTVCAVQEIPYDNQVSLTDSTEKTSEIEPTVVLSEDSTRVYTVKGKTNTPRAMLKQYFSDEIEKVNTEVHLQNVHSVMKEAIGLSERAIVAGESAHGSLDKFSAELDSFLLSEKIVEVSAQQREEILALISGGYSYSQAYAARITGKILNLSVDRLILEKAVELSENLSENEEETVDDEIEDDTILLTSIRMGVPYNVIFSYLENSAETADELLTRFNIAYREEYLDNSAVFETASSTTTRTATTTSYTPERILDNPYSYEELGDVSINLNTGSYAYEETDLYIPGINGLDLNFTRRYQTNNAEFFSPHTYIDEESPYANEICIGAGYRAYLYEGDDENGDAVLTPIYDMSSYTLYDPLEEDEDLGNIEFYNPYYLILFTAYEYQIAAAYKESLGEIWALAYIDGDMNDEAVLLFQPFISSAEPHFSQACINDTIEYDYCTTPYGLGYGWSLGFSTIERYLAGMGEGLKRRLVTSDGQKYEIDFYGGNSSNLVGYDRGDMILHNSGNGYSGARYTLEHSNGTMEYFNSSGELIAIVNRQGNSILFSYTYGSTGINSIQITDTLGNTIVYANENITYDPDNLDSVDGTTKTRYNVKFTLKLNGELIRTYYCRKNEPDDTSIRYDLIVAQDAEGSNTLYTYQQKNYDFNGFVSMETTNTGTRRINRLKKITYPNGLVREILAVALDCVERLGYAGYTEYIACATFKEYYTESEEIYTAHRTYEYGDYSALSSSLNKPYSTIVIENHAKTPDNSVPNRWPASRTVYSFDHETHNKNKETRYERGFIQYNDLADDGSSDLGVLSAEALPKTLQRVKETVYQHNTQDLPTQITTTFYNMGSDTAQMTQTYKYEYDSKGNVTKETLPNEQEVSYTYSATYSLPLTKTYKQNNGTTIVEQNTLTSDGKAIATTTTSANGTVVGKTEYSYDSSGRVTNQKNYLNSTDYAEIQYQYTTYAEPHKVIYKDIRNADGSLVSGSSGSSIGEIAIVSQYNDREDLVSQTDANGNTHTIEYDGNGRITKTTNPDGTFATYVYDVVNSTVTYTDERGTALRYEYDPAGNHIGTYDVAGNQYLYEAEYGCYGWITRERQYSSANAYTYYRYDAAGRVTKATTETAAGATIAETSYEYSYADGAFKTKTSVKGDTTAPDIVTTTYVDNMGWTVQEGRFLNGTEYLDKYTHDYVGNVITLQTEYSASKNDAYTYRYTYDTFGNVLTTEDALGNTITQTYDWLGNCVTASDPAGNVSYNTYDKLGRIVKQRQPFTTTDSGIAYATTKLYYDGNGNVITKDVSNNTPGSADTWARLSYEYDNRNRLTKATAYDDGVVENITQYYYDAGSNILRMYTGLSAPLTITGLDAVSGSDSNYAVTKYTYDRFSNPLTVTDAMNRTESYTYDLNGNVLTKTDRNGSDTVNTYDSLGRLLSTTAENPGSTNTVSVTYTYTLTGEKGSESNGILTSYEYDALGRKVKETTGTEVHTYTYDIGDNRTGYVLTLNGVQQLNNTYSYDDMERLVRVTDSAGNQTHYTYDANGNRSKIEYPNGIDGTYAYNKANLPTSITYTNNAGTELLGYDYTYALDGNQITKVKNNAETTTYSYDDLGRLLSENVRNGSGTVTQAYSYAYDDFGNRTGLTATGADAFTASYTYDLSNRLQQEVKTASGTSITTAYTHDANGNQLTKTNGTAAENVTNQYNGFNQLIRAVVGGTTAVYGYAPDGLRSSKQVGTVTTAYVLDGNDVVLETQGSTVTGKYLRGIGLIADLSGTTAEYYHHNAHGDVVWLTNASGSTVRTYDYDAFGNEKAPSAADTNPFRYSGEYYDAETGTYYLRARYYDPVTGRFTQEDPVRSTVYTLPNNQQVVDPLSLNLYTYCANNPVRYRDPSGNAWETAFDFLSFMASAKDMYEEPSLENLGFFAWDAIALMAPVIPGSYVGKGIKALDAVDDVGDAIKSTTKPVKAIFEIANSRTLRKNMVAKGIVEPEYAHAAHHIVAGGRNQRHAREARSILHKYGVGINDAINGVFLPRAKDVTEAAYHPSLHTDEYYRNIAERLRAARSQEDIYEILGDISIQLQEGTFPH